MKPFILSLLLGSSVIAHAANPVSPSDTIRIKEIKEITVLGGLSKTLALPMVVVKSDALQSASFFTPADALQQETGISIARDGIWAASVNVRGLSEQRLLIMVDGDRIQTASDHAAALSTIDMNSLEKIEVIKGASSVLFGTGAMGGVVNFVTERPTYSSNFQTKGKVGSEFNSVNSLWANSARVQFTTNKWYIALNGSYRTAQNIHTPGGILPNSQFNDASWGLKGGILYTPNQELQVNYQHTGAWDVGLPGGRSFPATATARYLGVERNQLSAEYIISNINRNLRELRIKAYTQNISRDVELKPADPTVTLFPGSVNVTSGAKVTTDWKITDYHSFVLGAEGWVRDAETYRLTFKNNADTMFTVTGDQPTPDTKMFDLGTFVQYTWKIIPRKLTFNTGLRFDFIQTANDTAFSPLFRYTVKNKIRTNVNNLARRILFEPEVNNEFSYAAHFDMVYNFNKLQLVTLSVSNSYRAASIEERFKFIELAGPKHVGDPNLKPERGTFSNLNYTVTNNKFRLKTDVYVNYLEDLIVEKSGIYTYTNASGTSVSEQAFINTNVSKAFFIGAEIEANWKITKQFSFLANASYTRARDLDADAFLSQIPPMHGFVSLNYQSKKQIGASFSTLWAARQAEIAATETATDGHIIFNLNVHSGDMQLNRSKIQLFAGVDNILNTAYLDHLSTTRGILKLEPGRNIYVKAKWGW